MDIFVTELSERLAKGEHPIMIDVREEHEWDMQHIDGIMKISLGNLPSSLDDLAPYKDQEVIMICRSGGRSGNACTILRNNGFTNVRNLTGGMLAWKTYIDPTFNVV